MATTFKAVVFQHHKKQDGTYNVKIRVTHNRQRRLLATNIFVTKEDLTRSFKIKSQNILDNTKNIIDGYMRITATISIQAAKDMNVDDVLKYIDTYQANNKVFKLDFISYAEKITKELEDTGRKGNSLMYKTVTNSLKCFLGYDTIDISEINVQFLNDYCQWLKTKPARKNRPDKDTGRRMPSLYLSTIRAIHNRAKSEFNDEDAGIINIPLSPFKKFKIPAVPVSRKRALTKEQFTKLINHPYELVMYRGFNRMNLAKDVFLLSFGLMGMNAVDLFDCTSYEGGYLNYNRTKTKNRRADAARMVVKVHPELMPLFEKYRDKTGKRVFCFYQYYSEANTFSAAINKGLKKIGEKIGIADFEFYAARHTWATLATNKVGIAKDLVHEALNHVDEKMRITDIYIEKDWRRIDDANKQMLEYVGLNKVNIKEEIYQRKFNKHLPKREHPIFSEE